MAAQGIRALVCDDDEVNQRIMSRLLGRFGIEVDVAANGREGLEQLAKQPYDIVFIDLNMPVIDGQEMAKSVRESQDPELAKTPLIAVTGAAHFFRSTPLAQTPFDDYIVKPVTPALVQHALKRTLLLASQGTAQK